MLLFKRCHIVSCLLLCARVPNGTALVLVQEEINVMESQWTTAKKQQSTTNWRKPGTSFPAKMNPGGYKRVLLPELGNKLHLKLNSC